MLPAFVLLLVIPLGGYMVAMCLFGSAGQFAGFIKKKWNAYRRTSCEPRV
jgi:hypothetical protein